MKGLSSKASAYKPFALATEKKYMNNKILSRQSWERIKL